MESTIQKTYHDPAHPGGLGSIYKLRNPSGFDKQFQCIDVFSKNGWVRCLKNKSGVCITKAFNNILSDGRIPTKLQTDMGTEFYNKHFQQLMDQYEIQHFTTSNETKASVVERFNRTFKTRMWRYLSSVNSCRYVEGPGCLL